MLPTPDANWAVFLDVDGTLIEIAETPEAVRVPMATITLLTTLKKVLGGAVAFVSGRSIAQLDRLFAPLHGPAAGLHGLERRAADGTVTRSTAISPELETARAMLHEFAEKAPGVTVEDKGLALALHYRRAPAAEAEARRLVYGVVKRVGDHLHVQEGKMVLEIKPNHARKDTVVDEFMSEPPFEKRIPLFAGDDFTDEDGFRAVNRLGGHSILVGHRARTDAKHQVGSVDDFVNWLERATYELARQAST